MAPILFHGLSQLGLPVVCVESRQAYQALKSLATHKTVLSRRGSLLDLGRRGSRGHEENQLRRISVPA